MKRLTKLSAFILSAMMLASITGCGNTSSTSSETSSESTADTSTQTSVPAVDEVQENTLPITTENIELTLYCHFPPGARQVYKDFSESPVVKVMEEQTGLTLNFIHPPENDDGTFFNTTIASGIYPDLFSNNFSTYPGGPEAAMQDGVLSSEMTDLVFQYAPNFLKLYEQQPDEIKKRFFSDNGQLIRMGTILMPPFLDGRVHSGMLIRQDLLEEYNLEMPLTVDEFENVFQTFKDNGIDVPLSMPTVTDSTWKSYNMFASAFDVAHDGFYLKDGTEVVYSRIQPEYKEYLALLQDWYSKGYLTSEFTTQNAGQAREIFQAGRAGMVISGNWLTENLNKVGQANDPDFYCTGVPYMRLNEDDELHLSSQMTSVDDRAWFVSSTCEHPVEAVRFLDYLYMDDTQVLTAMGPGTEECPTYEVIDGEYKFTDMMMNNPDFDLSIARDRYTANALQIMWFEPMEKQQYGENQVATWEQWGYNNDQSWTIPNVITPTVDESREFSQIMNTIDTYTSEMITKIIVGDLSLDEFDTMVAEVEKMNIARATEIRADAYARFLEREAR